LCGNCVKGIVIEWGNSITAQLDSLPDEKEMNLLFWLVMLAGHLHIKSMMVSLVSLVGVISF